MDRLDCVKDVVYICFVDCVVAQLCCACGVLGLTITSWAKCSSGWLVERTGFVILSALLRREVLQRSLF